MIFVSYSWKDRPLAERLCARLSAEGTDYWLDSEQLDTASPLEPQIHLALRRAIALMLLDTSASRASVWVMKERSIALGLSKRILVTDPAAVCLMALP